jgi:hypothetical protein
MRMFLPLSCLFFSSCALLADEAPEPSVPDGWRRAVLWKVLPARELPRSASEDCRAAGKDDELFALVSYRSNHSSKTMILPAGDLALSAPKMPAGVLIRPASCEAPRPYVQ